MERIKKVRDILNKGIKAQLMRGDRGFKQCWQITLDGIDKATEELDQIKKA